MATELQKNLARNIVNNLKRKKPLNKGELVEMSGYSRTTATQQLPHVFEQKGVQEELDKLGFTEHKAKRVVAQIMTNEEAEPNARLKAADMTFKVYGSYASEKSTVLNLNIEARLEDKTEMGALNQEYLKKARAIYERGKTP